MESREIQLVVGLAAAAFDVRGVKKRYGPILQRCCLTADRAWGPRKALRGEALCLGHWVAI
jgi:hypothetical protein